MKILDRYFVSSFIASFLWCMFAFVFFYIIIDLVGRIDQIIERNIPAEIVIDYYLSMVPLVFIRTCPLATLMATMYTISNFARNNELIAASAGGINPHRLLLPFLVFTFFLSLGTLAVNEKYVPAAATNAYRIKNIRIKGRKKQHLWKNRLLYTSNNRKLYIKLLDTETNTVLDMEVSENSNHATELSKFYAPSGKWGNGTWHFRNTILRIFDKTGKTKCTVNAARAKADTKGWLFSEGTVSKKSKIRSFTSYQPDIPPLEEKPEDFTKKQLRPEEMNFAKLKKHILSLKQMGFSARAELVSLYDKISFPVASFIVILTGIPLAVRQRKGGVLASFASALAICLVYYLLHTIGNVLGENFIPPAIGAWLANIIFASAGILALIRAPHTQG